MSLRPLPLPLLLPLLLLLRTMIVVPQFPESP